MTDLRSNKHEIIFVYAFVDKQLDMYPVHNCHVNSLCLLASETISQACFGSKPQDRQHFPFLPFVSKYKKLTCVSATDLREA